MWMHAGGSGKTSHGVKYVDARSRTDKRGEQRAEKLRKKSGAKGKSQKGGGHVAKAGIVKKKHKAKSHTSRR